MGRWRSWADTLAWTLLALLPLALTGCSGVAAGPPGQLSITTTSLPSGTVDVAYSATLEVSGGTVPFTWSITAGQLPPGLTLGATTGQISGTPTQSGSFSFTATVRDSSTPTPQASAKTLSINTTSATGPNISGISPTSGPSSGGTSVTITGTNFVSSATVLFGGTAATGVTVSSATQIRATTPAHAAGAVDVQVRNPSGQTATLAGGFTFIAGLQITTASLPGGTLGANYSVTLAATGGVSPYSWSVVSGQLPPGLSLQATTGQISGTPTQAGAFSLTIQVRDSSSQTATRAFTINITTGTVPLQITTSGLPTAILQSPYTATLTATGGTGAYTWSIVSGALPPGLTLLAASGQITGTPSQAGQFSFTVKVEDSSQPTRQSATKTFDLSVVAGQLDQYGGFVGAPCTGGATGLFYVEKSTSGRWHFCTPDGNTFFMQGVYNVGLFSINKYPDRATWAKQTVLRLKTWGFNTLSIYWWVDIVPISFSGGIPNPEKMPFIHIFRMAGRASRNRDGVGTGPVKALTNSTCTNPPAPHVSCNHSLTSIFNFWDVYDPNFVNYANNMAKTIYQNQGTYPADFPTSWTTGKQWCIGFVPDDSDNLTGLSGPGKEYPGNDAVIHYHPGHIVATAAPVQTNNASLQSQGCTPSCSPYPDNTVYSKRAWRDYLINKYGTVAALNAAWGSDYTTFGVDKGYPRSSTGSKGLLDEDGSGPWIGTDLYRQAGANANAVADMDAFLEQYAEQYYKTVATAIRAAHPGHLVFSNAPMNSHRGGMTRRPVLRAAGKWLDIIEVVYDPTRPIVSQETYKETSGKPMVTWTGFSANADSPYAGFTAAAWDQGLDFPTQQARGTAYATEMSSKFNLQAYDGSYPFIGTNYWDWLDLPRENTNWGLATMKDNAYDGKEAIIATGTDPWGYPTGGEAANYGDFLTAVRNAHLAIVQALLSGGP